MFGLVLIQACVAVPPPEKTVKNPSYSTGKIKHDRELIYAQKLYDLKRKNPVSEANSAIDRRDFYLMSYLSGRGGINKVPGLTQQELINNRCRYQTIAGFGDAIYGENHLRYRVAMRQYANQFNRIMMAYCR